MSDADPLRRVLELRTERIVSAQGIARALVDANKREAHMKAVSAAPFTLEKLTTMLNDATEKALARVQRAADGNHAAIKGINGVAEVIEKSTEATNKLVSNLMGSTNGNPSSEESDGSKASSETVAKPQEPSGTTGQT